LETRERLSHRYGTLPEPAFESGRTVLLIIDMQKHGIDPAYGVRERLVAKGLPGVADYHTSRLELIVGNAKRLLSAVRERGIEPVYVVVESLTRDGRDRSAEHKRLGIHHAPGSPEAAIVNHLAPREDEIVVKKTCSSAFNGTSLHYVLTNLGIKTVIVCGVITSGCVESTVRDASDLGYGVALVEDACATWTPEMQDAAVYAMREIYAKVYSTDEVLARLGVQERAALSERGRAASR